MSFLKFIEKVQEKMINKSEEIAKKVGATQEQLQANPSEALTNFVKKKTLKETKPKPEINKKKSKTVTPPKPDRSIEGISKQIIKQRDSFIRNGFEQYKFIANTGCCEKCAQLDGKHFPVKELKIGENAPPMHEGCRCSIAAYSDRREYDEWLDFISSGGTTAQWEKMKKQQRKTK